MESIGSKLCDHTRTFDSSVRALVGRHRCMDSEALEPLAMG